MYLKHINFFAMIIYQSSHKGLTFSTPGLFTYIPDET